MTELEGSLSADASIEGSIDNLYVVEIGDYLNVSNKPSIDGHTLMPGSTSTEIGLAKLTDLPGISVQGLIAGLNFPDGETVFQDDRGELSVPLDRYDTRAEVDAKLSSQASKLTTDIATAKSQAISQANRYTDDTVANAKTDLQAYADGAADGAVDRAKSYTDAEVVKAKSASSDYTDAQVAQAKSQMLSELDSRLVSTFKPQGSSAFADLPQPSAATLGYVYNVTDDFVTTEAFKEGAGKHLPAGTNVYVYQDGSSFGWDSFAGEVDLSALTRAIEGKQDRLSLPGNSSYYLDGTGAFSVPPDTTYGPVSTAQSGLAPKLSGISTQYLNGLGQWTTPAEGSGGGSTEGLDELAEKVNAINDLTTGINLLRGTRDFVVGTVPYGTVDSLKLDGTSTGPGQWYELVEGDDGFYYYRYNGKSTGASYKFMSVLLPSMVNGHTLTCSFEFMLESATTVDTSLFQIYRASLDGKSSANLYSFYISHCGYNPSEIKPFVWYKAVCHYDTILNLTEQEYLRIGITGAVATDLSRCIRYRKVKAEVDHVNNPIWSASPFDDADVEQRVDAIMAGAPYLLGNILSTNFIPANADVSTYLTPGVYVCDGDSNAATVKGLPDGYGNSGSFKLIVEYRRPRAASKDQADESSTPQQILLPYSTRAQYARRYSGGAWSDWVQMLNPTGLVPLGGGGTGATDAAGARVNLSAMGIATANGYYGMAVPNGGTTDYIRTTSNGLIPYSQDSTNGISQVGTQGWPFKSVWAKTLYGNWDGGTVTNAVKMTKGHWVHKVTGTQGTEGYLKFATITVGTTYVNTPMMFTLASRGRSTTTEVFLLFTSANSNDPAVNTLYYDGNDYGVAVHKSATSTFDLYVKKSEGWDVVFVVDYFGRFSIDAGMTLTWKDEQVSALPSGARTASPRLTVASHTANGLMSAADKTKLDGLESNELEMVVLSSSNLAVPESDNFSFTAGRICTKGNVSQLNATFKCLKSVASGSHTLFLTTGAANAVMPGKTLDAGVTVTVSSGTMGSGIIVAGSSTLTIYLGGTVASGSTITVCATYIQE